ncbi:MAG TPA: class I SAM-dependent methyltransferase [Gemmatales bacterium]|nr:class I SAM-dependent methyltransferase [Gemmatales bacterium]
MAEIRWETVPCPLCHAQAATTVLELSTSPWGRPLTLRQCRECTLGYLSPRPVRADLGLLYAQDYEAYQPTPVKPLNWRRRLAERFERWVSQARLNSPPRRDGLWPRLATWPLRLWFTPPPDALMAIPYTGQGRLLDCGCGAGWYLARMQARGWDVMGLDFSPHAVQAAREHYGLDVHVGSLPHPLVGPASFDVVTLGQVLEHVPDPHELIAAAVTALRPGGRLALSVPNLASWGRAAFGPYWWPLQLPLHLLHFTPTAMQRLLADHGLGVRELRMMRMTNWMQRSWQLGEADRWRQQPPPLPRWLGRRRLTAKLLTHWTRLQGQADGMRVLAEKPAQAPPLPAHRAA